MHSSARRTQLLASGLLVITFAVGCLVGATTDRVLSAREPADPPANPHPEKARDGKRHQMIDARLLNEISLSSGQRLLIDSILDLREREAKKLWKEQWVPRFNAMMEQTRGQVRAQLTPDQVKQLDDLIEEQRAQHKKHQAAPQQHEEENKPDKQPAPAQPDEREAAPRRNLDAVALTS